MTEDKEVEHFEQQLENLWQDMDKMTKAQLEVYTERLFTHVCALKYEQRAREEEERYWAHINAVPNV